MADNLQIGETKTIGVVVITRFTDIYQVMCHICYQEWKYKSPHTADWIAFTHNRSFRKEGCSKRDQYLR